MFEELNEKYERKVFIDPTLELFHRYMTDDMIVIDKLPSEAPKGRTEFWHTDLEKLLVDTMNDEIIGSTFDKAELQTVFENAFENYIVDESRLFRYARLSLIHIFENGGLLEYASVYGNFYGTPKSKVVEKLRVGTDIVLEIDIQGALNVKEVYPDGIFIFILPPSMAELRKRITGRGSESEEAINLRLSQTLKEVSYIDKYDYCVVNGDLNEAVARVKSIVMAEHSRVSQSIYPVSYTHLDVYKRQE